VQATKRAICRVKNYAFGINRNLHSSHRNNGAMNEAD
jgi:hypothetical protein